MKNQYNSRGQYNNQYNQNNQGGYYYNIGNNNNNQRGLGNKFILYDQYNQNNSNDEEKGKTKKIIIYTVCSILLIILIVILFKSCGKSNKLSCSEDYREVGNETYGYVCIPSDWVNFDATGATSGIRFSDINTEYILTLDSVSTTEKSALEYANEIVDALKNVGLKSNMKEVNLNNYKAYKVVGAGGNYILDEDPNNDFVYIAVYFFEEDNKTHYIGIERYSRVDASDDDSEELKIAESYTKTKKEQ